MNSDYYLEFRRKSYEIEQNFGHTTREETSTVDKRIENFENTDENLLNDYELVINEDLDDSGEENIIGKVENPFNYSAVNLENNKKLSICLGAEKIALKSQTVKTNKSIKQETETTQEILLCSSSSGSRGGKALEYAKQQQQQQPQHVPLAFTIVPIDVANKFGASADSNNLPEIVLTSFETKSTTLHSNDARKLSLRKPTTVTFKNKNFLEMLPPTTQIAPPPPPPLPATPEVIVISNSNKETNAKIINATVVGGNNSNNNNSSKLQEECNDDNEINSLPGSSTSPESYLDNILSAASSVSVRSSSLSSSAEVANFLVGSGGVGGGNGNKVRNAIPTLSVSGGASGAIAKQQTHKPQRKSQQGLLTNVMSVNRSLNLKSTSMNSSMSTLTATTTTTTPTATTRRNIDIVEVVEEPLQQYLHNHHAQHLQPHQQQTATLQPPAIEAFETNSTRSRSPSPSHNISIRVSPDPSIFPEQLKCVICADVFRDPRTLNCLHSFCFQCLVDENFKQDSSIPFWSQPNANDNADWKTRKNSNSLKSSKESSPEISLNNIAGATVTPLQRQRSSFSFRRKKSLEKAMAKSKSDGRSSTNSSPARQSSSYTPNDKARSILCKMCNYSTELPIGGLRQLPQNFILVRKIEELKLKVGEDVITRVWCSLCFEETNATYHCISCTLNLCTLCKEAHERQRNTADHRIKNILELRKARRKKQNILNDNKKFTLKCGMHPGFEMKSFCITCLQVACADCLVLLHKGHKHESISKAFTSFSKILRDSTEQTRPLCTYAEHSIGRLTDIAKSINQKCDAVQAEVENFMVQYFEALEVHQKTLLNQVQRARDSKVEMILEQQLDLEKRSNEAIDAVRFSEELTELGSDVELLSFVNMLLKRFEFCSQFKTPTDPKISEALNFLPHIRAPSTKTQNNIPLYGIITMQTVEPSLCTLDTEAFSQLRLHKKAELIMLSRDANGVALCHGGLQIQAHLKYKEFHTKFLPVEVSDHRDGTYGITFVPDSQGTMLLTVTINDKPIKGSPFTFLARTVRPHSGIFHCCAFCSSKGNKLARCSCEGRMPGYNGCGHGHAGHPGRRHWSCCGNVLENSECSAANKLLNL